MLVVNSPKVKRKVTNRAHSESRLPSRSSKIPTPCRRRRRREDSYPVSSTIQKKIAPSHSDSCLSAYSSNEEDVEIVSAAVDSFANLQGAYNLQADLDILTECVSGQVMDLDELEYIDEDVKISPELVLHFAFRSLVVVTFFFLFVLFKADCC